MRHRAQNSSSVFVKQNIEELPMTTDELQEHMENFSGTHLAKKINAFWNNLKRYKVILEKKLGRII